MTAAKPRAERPGVVRRLLDSHSPPAARSPSAPGGLRGRTPPETGGARTRLLVPPGPLTLRDLNRATLARQMLLAREKTTVLEAVERLVGLQAQLARPPFLALWARLLSFEPEALTRLVHARKLVRGTLMRGTLHLVSAKDYRLLRPALQATFTESMRAVLGDRVRDVDIEGVVARARECLRERPQTFEEIRAVLARTWPRLDARAMGYAVRLHLPLVQVPTDARWGWPASSCFASAEEWLGATLPTKIDLPAIVRRYLAAFGPASARDAHSFLGLRDLAAVFESLRPQLAVVHDERGRELFDLPEAPRPPGDTPAPVRFLPDFDNLLLGHADRTRVASETHRTKLATKNLRILPVFLVDGFVAGTWAIVRSRKSAVLQADPFVPLDKKVRGELTEEGTALLRFSESDAQSLDVRFG